MVEDGDCQLKKKLWIQRVKCLHIPGYYNGVKGIFIGTDTQPVPADYDKYLFLPLAGFGNTYNAVKASVEARYWTSTELSAENFYDFSFNSGGVTIGTGQYYKYGESIRCVKRK